MHALVIPVTGLARLYQAPDDLDVRTLLAETDPDGQYITWNTAHPGGTLAMAWMLGGPPNPRARAAVAVLTGVHIVLTGDVALLDLSEEETVAILRDMRSTDEPEQQ